MSLLEAPAPRTDGMSKVTGDAIYGVDYAEAGMRHAALLRSPVPAGRITRLDTTTARALPGVRAIVTAADAPDTHAGWVLRDQRLFASDHLHYEGEPIAGVVADTLEQARAAIAAIELEIEEWEPVYDLRTAGDESTRVIHPDWETFVPTAGGDYPRRGNIAAEMISDPGGVDEGFAAAHQIIEDEFVVDRQYQAYLEPKAAVGIYRDGRYTVHTASQFPFNVRDRLAQFFDIRPTDIRVVGHTIGGGFGAKLDAAVEQYAAFLARFAGGRAVKLVNTRTEDLLVCPVREGAITRIRSAIDAEGNVLAREYVVIADNGAHSGEMPWLASLPLHLARGVYRCGPTRVISQLMYTNTAPTGAFRGVNGPYLYHAVERHTDNIANAAGIDRREYRLRHVFQDGEVLLNGQVLDDASIITEAFEELEKVAPWAKVTSEPARPGMLRGVGIAAAWWLTNPLGGNALVRVNEDGTIGVTTGANDNGSGAVSLGVTQIVAHEMGVKPSDVRVTLPDTDFAAFDGGSQGSRTTYIVGKAAVTATAEVKAKLRDTAAGMLEASPDDIVIADGKVFVAGSPGTAVSLGEVATAATFTTGPITGSGSFMTTPPAFNPGCGTGVLFPVACTPSYHVHLAEVEVDPVTGNVRVTRYVVAQEMGKMIHRDGCYGQVAGGVAQGIGYALYENLRIGTDGRYKERTLESYRLPLSVDIPRVEMIALEHPDPHGPHGAKGVGECAVLLPASTIANAVSDAIGKPFNHIPITPEHVLAALQENPR